MRRITRFLGSLPLLFLLHSSVLGAQSTELRGAVRHGHDGAPLSGTQIRVLETGRRATTDARGRFRIEASLPGDYVVEASRLGFATLRRPVTLLAGATTDVDFTLDPEAITIPAIQVIGSQTANLDRIPGSAEVITREELVRSVPLSGNEVLKRVPGVHVQEEEGVGLRANIGIRGLDPDRSRTVLMLEDGVPVALNPYGEPEMYYTPPIDRMERVEIIKGSGSILFGPQTIGGVINYVTANPPATPRGTVDAQRGAGGYLRALGTYGGTWGNVGATAGLLHKRADDLRGLFFHVTDLTGKVGFGMGDHSRLGVKLSLYDEESNSTYVGLTEAMFLANPNRHPAPDDRLRMRRYAASATHDLLLGAGAALRTTAYGYTTTRDWQRQDFGYSPDGTQHVFRPSTGNRNRSFEVLGIEPRLQMSHGWFGVPSEMDAGFRAHHERALDAHINGTTATAQTGDLRDYEIRTGNAVAAFFQNRFFLGDRVQVIPGMRVERFSYDRNILRTRVRRENPVTGATTRLPEDVDIRSSDDLFEVIPGIGATWNPSERVTLFAGAHRGFAPPRVKDALIHDDQTLAPGQAVGDPVSLQLDAERSWNLEIGTRARPFPAVSAEVTGFLLDFSNQIIPPSLSSGSVAQAQLANQGETRHLGVEGALGVDVGEAMAWPFGLTAQVKHTYVRAEFSTDRFIRNATGDTVNVRGNRLPYAPEHLLVLSFGVDHASGLNLQLDGTRVASQFADNFETVQPLANGRNGLIPAYSVWNVAASYAIPRWGVTAFGTVKNLFDETYIASRRPQGIKPGLPRLLNVGVRVGI
jgi:Fe(3+) dicitrate transport protein